MATGLSKNLREVLQRLATSKEVETMLQLLAECMEIEKTRTQEVVEFDIAPEPEVEWSEGVEHLKDKTPEELYGMLGLEKYSIPFLKEKITMDPDGSGDLEVLSTGAVTTEGFSLRWHQLVGVTKMVERAMNSEPVLLMDDVGLGKTVQVLGLFAMLAYYRSYHKKHNRYPGIWGK